MSQAAGDSVFSVFNWSACAGGIGQYPPFHVTARLDTTVIFDSLVTTCGESTTMTFTTSAWRLQAAPDTHWVIWRLDPQDSVHETIETDNTATTPLFIGVVPPMPIFVWITPATSVDTVYGDTMAVVRWNLTAEDPTDTTKIWFYADNDNHGHNGSMLLSLKKTENGPDSLLWDIRTQLNGWRSYLYVRMRNSYHDTLFYAPAPVERQTVSVGERPETGIPTRFFLAQNFPNPFNPTTDLRYGVTRSGLVSLKVYDVLGREVATLVNGTREPGNYLVTFDGSHLASGLYLYTLTTPEGTQSHKMVLMQ
jgi:hypothetical protein